MKNTLIQTEIHTRSKNKPEVNKLHTEQIKVESSKDFNVILAENICDVINQLLLAKDTEIKECYLKGKYFKVDYLYKGKLKTATQPLH